MPRNTVILAIDPGVNGGMAVWFERDDTVFAVPMPETTGDMLERIKSVMAQAAGDWLVCYMEQVGGFIKGNPRTGSSMFKFGYNYGFLQGAIQALGIRLISVRPQKWQKPLGIGTKGDQTTSQWKNKLKGEAQRRFPGLNITLNTADSLLILDCARSGVKLHLCGKG